MKTHRSGRGARIASWLLVAMPGLGPSTTMLAAEPPPVEESVRAGLVQALPNIPGKVFASALVTFPPGARAAPHRHGGAFVYAYVLSGAVRSQLDDGPARVYVPGDEWFELPGARHRLTENTSASEPATLLVVFIANTGEPLKVADPE